MYALRFASSITGGSITTSLSLPLSPSPSTKHLHLLLFLPPSFSSSSSLSVRCSGLRPLLEIPPAPDPAVPRLFPRNLVLPPPLPALGLLVHLPLLPPFLLHLRLDLFPPPGFPVHEHLHRFLPPRGFEFGVGGLHFGTVDGEFAFAHQEHAGVGDAFVEVLAGFFVHEGRLGFFEAVEGVGGAGVGGLVRVDEEGFFAVGYFYVGFGDAGLEVEDCVAF